MRDYYDALDEIMDYAVDADREPSANSKLKINAKDFYDGLYVRRRNEEAKIIDLLKEAHMIHVIGERGSGKSSLLNALPRLYQTRKSPHGNLLFLLFDFFSNRKHQEAVHKSLTGGIELLENEIKADFTEKYKKLSLRIVKHYGNLLQKPEPENHMPSSAFTERYTDRYDLLSNEENKALKHLDLLDIGQYCHKKHNQKIIIILDNFDSCYLDRIFNYEAITSFMEILHKRLPTYKGLIRFIVAIRHDIYHESFTKPARLNQPGHGTMIKNRLFSLDYTDLLTYLDVKKEIEKSIATAISIGHTEWESLQETFQDMALQKFERSIAWNRKNYLEKYANQLCNRDPKYDRIINMAEESYAITATLNGYFNYDRRKSSKARRQFCSYTRINYKQRLYILSRQEIETIFFRWFITNHAIGYDTSTCDIVGELTTESNGRILCNLGFMLSVYLNNHRKLGNTLTGINASKIIRVFRKFGYPAQDVINTLVFFHDHAYINTSKNYRAKGRTGKEDYLIHPQPKLLINIVGLIQKYTYMITRIAQENNFSVTIDDIMSKTNIERVISFVSKMSIEHISALKSMINNKKSGSSMKTYLEEFSYRNSLNEAAFSNQSIEWKIGNLLLPRLIRDHISYLETNDISETYIKKYKEINRNFKKEVIEIYG